MKTSTTEGVMHYTPHADPVVAVTRRIDSAAELMAPILTDGLVLRLIERVLSAGRLEFCGSLEAMERDTEYIESWRRNFAAALRIFIQNQHYNSRANVCIGCYLERCR
jgi:hypothetical protein